MKDPSIITGLEREKGKLVSSWSSSLRLPLILGMYFSPTSWQGTWWREDVTAIQTRIPAVAWPFSPGTESPPGQTWNSKGKKILNINITWNNLKPIYHIPVAAATTCMPRTRAPRITRPYLLCLSAQALHGSEHSTPLTQSSVSPWALCMSFHAATLWVCGSKNTRNHCRTHFGDLGDSQLCLWLVSPLSQWGWDYQN